MSIAGRTRTCPLCGGARTLHEETCPECQGAGTILLPETPIRGAVSARDQSLARIQDLHHTLDALAAMVRQCDDSITAARLAVELTRTLVARARSLESTVVAAVRDGRRREGGA